MPSSNTSTSQPPHESPVVSQAIAFCLATLYSIPLYAAVFVLLLHVGYGLDALIQRSALWMLVLLAILLAPIVAHISAGVYIYRRRQRTQLTHGGPR